MDCARDELVGERPTLGPRGDFEKNMQSQPLVPVRSIRASPGPEAGEMPFRSDVRSRGPAASKFAGAKPVLDKIRNQIKLGIRTTINPGLHLTDFPSPFLRTRGLGGIPFR